MNITELGQILYGTHWQTPLARAVGVSNMTVYRWMTDGVPVERSADLVDAARRRYEELGAANTQGTKDAAAIIWPYATRARVSELVGVSPATLSRAGDDWDRWSTDVHTKRSQIMAAIGRWAEEQRAAGRIAPWNEGT